MPAAAQALGAVERELPLSGIAAAIINGVRGSRVAAPPASPEPRASAAAR
jgi:hypothetical protein